MPQHRLRLVEAVEPVEISGNAKTRRRRQRIVAVDRLIDAVGFGPAIAVLQHVADEDLQRRKIRAQVKAELAERESGIAIVLPADNTRGVEQCLRSAGASIIDIPRRRLACRPELEQKRLQQLRTGVAFLVSFVYGLRLVLQAGPLKDTSREHGQPQPGLRLRLNGSPCVGQSGLPITGKIGQPSRMHVVERRCRGRRLKLFQARHRLVAVPGAELGPGLQYRKEKCR